MRDATVSSHRSVAAGLAVLLGLVATAATAHSAPGPGRTELLSVATDGSPVAGVSPRSLALSADGRFAAFTTGGALDPGDTDADDDVYLRDRVAPGSTVWISRGPGRAGRPSLSASGRFVAFDSTIDLAPAGTSRRVLVCDRDPDGDGVFDERRPDGTVDHRVTDVSRVIPGRVAPFDSDPGLSADGTTVVWNEVRSGGAVRAVVARLRVGPAGTVDPPAPESYRELVPVEPGVPFVLLGQEPPLLSADGWYAVVPARLCTFFCGPSLRAQPTLQVGPAMRAALYVVELTGTGPPVRIDVGPDGAPLGLGAAEPAISADGTVVAFTVDRPEGRQIEVVERDPDADGRLWPQPGQPARWSVGSRAPAGPGGGSQPALSADGRILAFRTTAVGMHNGGDRAAPDGVGTVAQVVARDIRRDARRDPLAPDPAELVSVSSGTDCPSAGAGCPGSDDSGAPVLSADGSVIGFTSSADDLGADGGEAVDPGPALGAPAGLLVVDGAYVRVLQPTPQAEPVELGNTPAGGGSTVEVPVRHQGFGRLRIDSVTISGPAAGAFTLPATGADCVGTDLYQDDVCRIVVGFTPTGTPGPREATLVLVADGRSTSVPLTGTVAVSPPDPTPTPTEPTPTATPVPAATPAATEPPPTPSPPPGTAPEPDPALPGTLPPGSAQPAAESTGSAGIVVVSPAVSAVGRVVQVTGTGFPPDRAVAVTLRGSGAAPATARTDGTGAFTVPLLLAGGGSIGPVPVVATVDGVAGEATAVLLVTSGSYQPPGFVGRR